MKNGATRSALWLKLRRPASTAACFALASLLLVSSALFRARFGPERAVVDGVPPAIPLTAEKSLGINADLSRYDAVAREEALAAMEEAGFHWLRQRFPWDAIEPQPGVYDWAAWDAVVEDVYRHNLTIVAVLDRSPEWARAESDAGGPLAPPHQVRDYGAFVAAFVARYREKIDYYQIWDEPNIAPHWGAREIDPAAYASLLREGAIQVRSGDPGAIVLLAALAPTVEPGGANMSELSFLDALYQCGAGEWFDVVAAQLYPFDDAQDAPPDPDRLNWRRAFLLRQVIESHGDGETAVWAVSFGSIAADPGPLVRQARQDWPWLGPMLWAAWSAADLHGEYALLGAAGQATTQYGALRAVATAPPIAWPGVHRADDPSGLYEGAWRVTRQGADIGESGDRLAIRFWGTRLDLAVRRGDYRAFLFVTVDGQPANALPCDETGRAYAVLYDPLRREESVTIARDLPLGEHMVEIIAERGWGQWAIAGWTVSRQSPGWAAAVAVILGLAALFPLAAAGCLLWAGRRSLLAAWRWSITRYRALDDRLTLAITAALALLVYVTVGTVPSLLALGLLALALLLRPQAGLPLIALALPFYQPGKPLLGKLFSMVEILVALTALAWAAGLLLSHFLRSLEGDRRAAARISLAKLRFTPFDWAVVALVLWGAVSLLWPSHPREAAREFRIVILEAGVFYGLVRVMVRAQRDAWRIVDAWVLGASLAALVGLCQYVFGQSVIKAEDVWRVRAFYGSPNNLALYLGRVFPLVVAVAAWFFFSPRARATAWRWRGVAYSLAAIVMAAVLFLTYSRGAWVLGVPAALLFLAVMRGRRAFGVAVGVLAVIAVVVILIAGFGRLGSVLETGEGTTFLRLQLWRSSWSMVRDHPVLGVGLDSFLYEYRTAYVLPTAWEEFNLSHPHNLVLDFWLRLGLPGVLWLGWVIVLFFRRGWYLYSRSRLASGTDWLLILGLMAGMVNFLAHGLVDAAFFLVDLSFVFMLMLAFIQLPFGATEAK
ncbi:MAG: O-antigen ligase family protein [Anaerolineae bacterium]|nr:O-antigen ligase family protein [Anaerolineae bacterium]